MLILLTTVSFSFQEAIPLEENMSILDLQFLNVPQQENVFIFTDYGYSRYLFGTQVSESEYNNYIAFISTEEETDNYRYNSPMRSYVGSPIKIGIYNDSFDYNIVYNTYLSVYVPGELWEASTAYPLKFPNERNYFLF